MQLSVASGQRSATSKAFTAEYAEFAEKTKKDLLGALCVLGG
jgi:hypothetical protein